MSAALTYHVRAAQLSAVAVSRVFNLPTHKDASRTMLWDKVQELKPGKYTLWDHCFELPHQPPRQSPIASPRSLCENSHPEVESGGRQSWCGATGLI